MSSDLSLLLSKCAKIEKKVSELTGKMQTIQGDIELLNSQMTRTISLTMQALIELNKIQKELIENVSIAINSD